MVEGPRQQDEIRSITAMFADIVGSTALGERLGPDEAKALVGECVTRMRRAVEEFGGVIQAYMGDGICAYLGVPAVTWTIRSAPPEPRCGSSPRRRPTPGSSRAPGASVASPFASV